MKALIMLVVAVFILTACTGEDVTPQAYMVTHDDVVFRGFKTTYRGDVETPSPVIVDSQTKLDKYLEETHDQEQAFVGSSSFDAYIKALPEDFFDTYAFIVIRVEENSGSITHDLNQLEVNNHTLSIHIDRMVPDGGMTMDMAGWYLVVELPKDTYEYDDVAVHVSG